MSSTAHRAFFGDLEHTFDLAKPELIRELEAVTGAGIGGLISRVINERRFHHADLEHVIRLGLIGGGTDPKIAARLIANYLPARPLEEAMLLAIGILGALFFGAAEEPPDATRDADASALLASLQEPGA